PSGPGVPPSLVIHTITASYNDLVEVEAIFSKEGEEIAAVIMEPVAGNMGIVEPLPGFCEGLRQITKEYGALLIFDEVITGFRLAWGGAGTLMGVEPDLTCLGKIIGGGLPVGAYGGKQEIMELLAPTGPVYQAGTLSGNPLAMSAGLAVLHELSKPGVYESLAKKTEALAVGLKNAALSAGAKVTVNQCGSLLTCFFTGGPVHDYQSATTANTEKYKRFFQKMLERGVYLPPSQFEALFLSLAHSDNDIDTTLKAAAAAFKAAI
ncbi:MAG: aminotransferase class III-fold pyridoxal phosphate-dependent enzyme, partial [Desulfitobacteriaceae bacterium]|nr:aminotransferase class III-fold pyridoxal phosphate-dependent enzyme [Desulfitobacteriaceae bacterium]